MSNRQYSLSIWRWCVIATVILCGGSVCAVFGQYLPGETSSGYHPPNPTTSAKRFTSNRPVSRSKQTASNPQQPPPDTRADDKQQDIERAIADGNEARNKNDYKQALDHYQKVAKELNPKDARAFYGMGNLYSDLSCYESAIEAYRSALDLKKEYLEALIGLGYAYMSKERYDEAETQFQAAHELKPNNIEANLGLGRVYAKKGKFQEAVTQVNQVINAPSTENKDRAMASLALGLVYEDQNKWQDAIAQYEKAIRFNPDLVVAYLQLGLAQLVTAFSKFASLTDGEIRTQDTESMSAAGRQAAENVQRAIERHFDHPYVHWGLGFARLYQFNYQGAADEFNAYIAKVNELETKMSSLATKCDNGLSSLKAAGYWALGFMFDHESSLETDPQRKTELLNAASKPIEQAIKLKPDYAIAYDLLGQVYLRQGRFEDAAEQYKKALNYETKESNKARKYSGIGTAYFQMGRYSEALNYLNQAVKLNPNDSSVYAILSLIYQRQGNFDEAIVQAKKAMEFEPRATAGSYYFLASAYLRRARKKGADEDYAEAIGLLKKALEINDAFTAAYFLLGQSYKFYKAGVMADEAIANYKKAIEYDPKNPAYYFHLADFYFAVKHNDEAALEYLKKTIELKPDYADAYWERGLVYRHKKDDNEAVKQLLIAIKYDEKYLEAYTVLAEIYKNQRNYPEAVKYLTTATELAPTNFYPYKELAKVYEAQGNNKEAIHYYEEALNRLDAGESWTKNIYLGRIERLRGHYAEAIAYFQKLPQPPTEIVGQTQYDIGLTYIASKNKKAAIEQYQQLVQLKSPLVDELLKKIEEMK
jgi:tetratricopeptide (TPR) repeat protein